MLNLVERFWRKTLLLIALLGALVILWLRYAPSPTVYTPTQGPVTVAEPPKELVRVIEKIKIVKVPGPERIVYWDRPTVAAKLDLPEMSLPDNVLSVASVKPSRGETIAIASMTPSGEGVIHLQQRPPKFLEVKKEFTISAIYLPVGTNYVEAGIQVNPVRLGGVELVAGAGVEVERGTDDIGLRLYVGAEYKF